MIDLASLLAAWEEPRNLIPAGVAVAVVAPLAAPVPSLSGLTVAVSLAAAPVVVAAGAVVSVLDARRLVRTG